MVNVVSTCHPFIGNWPKNWPHLDTEFGAKSHISCLSLHGLHEELTHQVHQVNRDALMEEMNLDKKNRIAFYLMALFIYDCPDLLATLLKRQM